MRTLAVITLVLLVAGGAFYYTKYLRAEQPPNFRVAEAERGNLLVTISATGTLEPEEVVDVGAQVVGRIRELGVDSRAATNPKYKDKHVDYNSTVKQGDLLAQIDPSLFKATYDQAVASLARAEADVLQAKARLAQTKAEYDRATRLRNVKLSSSSALGKLSGQIPSPMTIKGISDADYIQAKANYEVAVASVNVAQASVEQAKAMVFSAETNLKYTTIASPVDGTIIDRRVNVGQTVVASLNAPSLFLIAKDLRRMQIWTAVNEADIGQLKIGMPVSFTVDAFPDQTFHGEVAEIRLNAEMQNHVVVYRVIVSTRNDDLKLLPYLSARVDFEIERREDVLLVPNAALRYTPRPELIASSPLALTDEEEGESDAADETAAEVRTSETDDDASEPTRSVRRVWVRKADKVYPVDVETGSTNGLKTEVLSGELKPGMEVVLGEELAEVTTEATNPLAPPRLRGKKKDTKKS